MTTRLSTAILLGCTAFSNRYAVGDINDLAAQMRDGQTQREREVAALRLASRPQEAATTALLAALRDETNADARLAAVEAAASRGAVAAAAMLVGVGEAMIDLAVAYAGQREQFGQPIGTFQAVKHHLADALVDVRFARPLVERR